VYPKTIRTANVLVSIWCQLVDFTLFGDHNLLNDINELCFFDSLEVYTSWIIWQNSYGHLAPFQWKNKYFLFILLTIIYQSLPFFIHHIIVVDNDFFFQDTVVLTMMFYVRIYKIKSFVWAPRCDIRMLRLNY
jgi:hypothetical protein